MLTEWIIPIAYLLGWLLTTRVVAVRSLDETAQEELERRATWGSPERRGKPLVDADDRMLAILLGFVTGVFWPLVLVGMIFSRSIRTPTERAEDARLQAEKDRAELDALRRQARDLGLPMPSE